MTKNDRKQWKDAFETDQEEWIDAKFKADQQIKDLADKLRRDRLAYMNSNDGWNMWGKRKRN